MNQKTHFTLSFYHLNLAIRDTLEYIQNRPNYPVGVWKAKGNTLALALKDNSPFAGFCSHNGEIGEKIKEQLKDMYDTVYSEEATFISVEGEAVVPDHAQNLKVLDFILPLRQSLTNISRAYIEDQRHDGSLEDGVEDIINTDDKFYRAVCNMVLADILFNVHFAEFNKVMRENNGKESPASNFCANDIKKVIGMYNFVKQNTNDEELKAAEPQMDFCIKLICGEEKVPEGSTFKDEFNKAFKGWYDIVARVEPVWREKHQVIWGQLVEYERGVREKLNAETK
ncbi:MAG: hypothetical protein PUA56_06105 [Bacillales bacterium]|nr:hypothetical protein [Bacillales bacterium]